MENMSTMSSTKSKDNRDERNRDSKLEEQVLKSLGNTTSSEEKLTQLVKKFVELERENKKLNATLKAQEKRFEIMTREKDNLQKEYNKGVLMRDKLEQVCREQQKLIKSVKNESLTKIREEEERRKENQTKFQQSINEINVTLSKNNEENIKLREDNLEMTKKLKYLAEQYQAREKQLEKINEQMQLEYQLHEAKLAKFQMEATIEKEILLREKQGALDELLTSKKAMQEQQNREELLKEQLNLYTSKYDDFQSSLQKSNDIFTSYKAEIEKMSKNTKKLEKESLDWRRKWEKSNATLINLATEKQSNDEYIGKLNRQVQQLEKLLRTMQVERTTLHQILKDNNIERPAMPVLPPEPEKVPAPPPVQKYDKLDSMVKNCAELKQTLAKLQGQMNEIATKQKVETQQPEEKDVRKSKNKKSKNKNKSCPTKERQIQPTVEIADKNQEVCSNDNISSTPKVVGSDNDLIIEDSAQEISNQNIITLDSVKDNSTSDDSNLNAQVNLIDSDERPLNEAKLSTTKILELPPSTQGHIAEIADQNSEDIAKQGSEVVNGQNSIIVAEKSSVAATELNSVAATEKSSVASTEQSSVAATEQSSVAATEQSSVAATEQSSVAATEQSSVAATEQNSDVAPQATPENIVPDKAFSKVESLDGLSKIITSEGNGTNQVE